MAHSVFIYSKTSVYTGQFKVKPNDNYNVTELTILHPFQRTWLCQSSSPCLAAPPLCRILSQGRSSSLKNKILWCLNSWMATVFFSSWESPIHVKWGVMQKNHLIKAPSRSSIPFLYSLAYKWRSEGPRSVNKFLFSKEPSECASAVEKHNRIFVLPPSRMHTVTHSKMTPSTMVHFRQLRKNLYNVHLKTITLSSEID